MTRKKALLIAEKPSLMKEIQHTYNGNRSAIPYDIDFTTFAGHVMSLVPPADYTPAWEKWDMAQLPMMPDNFIYKPTSTKQKMYSDVKAMVLKGGYDFGIVATDPGREGELIAWAFLDEIGTKIPFKRLWFSDLTEGELTRALKNLRDYDDVLNGVKEASYKRSQMDWLIGMNFSRAYGMLTKKKAPLGRVMTPTLKIVVDRELELRNFVPKPFWELEGDFGKYQGLYLDEEGNASFDDKAKAKAMIPLFGKKGTVVDVTKKKETKYAPELHSLANLQNECNRAFGYTMSETLAVAQSLYEKKLLSYPRTDSAHLTEAIAKDFTKMLKPLLFIPKLKDEADDVIKNKSIQLSVAKNKKYVNDKKVTDHYAITPTGLTPDFGKLTKDEENVYMTVARRFLSIFLPPMVTEKTAIVTDANGHTFKTNGSILIDLGFMRLYPTRNSDTMLPVVKKGEVYDLVDVNLVERKTSPPQRYNDETLGRVMENVSRLIDDDELKEIMKEKKGIGTPATRGNIVDKLVDLTMIERKKKSFYATDYGISLIEGLGDLDITSPMLTATWEQKLTEMEKANYDSAQFDNEMRDYISKTVTKLKGLKVSIASDKPSLGKCPKCGRNVIDGKKFYLCESYKDACDFIVGHDKWGTKISKTELKKILEGKATKKLKFQNGEKEWEASLIFDKAKGQLVFDNGSGGSKSTTGTSTSGASKTSAKADVKLVGKCPSCSANVKETDKYFLCENYKNPCKFLMTKEFKGAKITATDMKALLAGKETKEKEFVWSSGKTGKAKLKYTTKLEFVFSN
jgi:DNA topoisomerase-3